MTQNRVPLTKQIPVKLPPEILERLDEVSKKIGEPRSTIMRMAMRLGLGPLERALESPDPELAALLATAAEKSDPSAKSAKSETRYPTPHELQNQTPALNDPKSPGPDPAQGVSPQTEKKILATVKKHVRPPAGRRSAARPRGKVQPAPPPAPAPEAP